MMRPPWLTARPTEMPCFMGGAGCHRADRFIMVITFDDLLSP
ncbi:MAG: hypothetical protein ACOCY2_04185 [Guyparkeria sp.]